MNWGKSIIVAFILFGAFIATLVTVCVRQDVSLVSPDYYQQELVYQDQIARINNTSKLIDKPVITVIDNQSVEIRFNQFSHVEKGMLHLFRPSDDAMDQKINFTASEQSSRSFKVSPMEKGMYRARMQWTMNGEEFFIEEIIHI